MFRFIPILFVLVLTAPLSTNGATIFESGTLGPTGIPREDVLNQVVLGANLNSNAFNGVRFELLQPVITSKVGGHFVGAPDSDDTLFGAIIQLEDKDDFPNSADLSTPDVLGHALVDFPEPSNASFGDLVVSLQPGWYALVFGSGLFGAAGDGALPLNNSDVGMQSYLGYLSGFGWGNRPTGMYFAVNGAIVPEPANAIPAITGLALLAVCKRC